MTALFATVVSADDDDGGGGYRDSLERAGFAEKLSRFERLTCRAAVAPPSGQRSSLSRPSSAPVTAAAASRRRGSPAAHDPLRPAASDSGAPAVPCSRGWTRRGHRVGVVETPTGDLDLDAAAGLRAPVPGLTAHPDEVNPRNSAPLHSRRVWEDAASSSSPQKKTSPTTCVKRHSGPRDRLHDVRAAILASAAAKLSSTAGRSRSSSQSPDWLRPVKSGAASSTGSQSPQTRATVEYHQSEVADLENGTNSSSDDSNRPVRESDEQSSQSTCSSSSNRTAGISTSAQKPPTGRALAESTRLTKQSDRRNFDKASSFFRSLLSRPRSFSPNRTSSSSCPAVGKSASPDDVSLNESVAPDEESPISSSSKTGDSTVLVSPQSSPQYFTTVLSDTATASSSLDSSVAESFESSTLKCTTAPIVANLFTDSDYHRSFSEHSKSSVECSESENTNDYQGEKLFTRDTVTTTVVIPDIGKSSALVSTADHQGLVNNDLNSSGQRLRSTAELVINSAGDNRRDLKRSDHQLSVDASPHQNRKVRKVVTFAEERNSGASSLYLGSPCIELPQTMNGDMQAEPDKTTNNNSVVSRLTANETVQLSSANADNLNQSDVASDVSNANIIQTNEETMTAAVGSNNSASNMRQDLLQGSESSASVWSDVCKSAVMVNGHESNDISAADDSASISDVESEDLSASQQDLRTQYQQRRAERLQEQKAAELEKQRLEEILKLCTEFGLSSDVPASLLVSEEGSSSAEKTERRNSLGRIKTNGSLTKLVGLQSAELSSVVERRMSQSGSASNSDDDIDRGTVRRRPFTTKNNISSVTGSNTVLPVTTPSDRTVSDTAKVSRTTLARTGSGTLPAVGISVESAGRSKSVPMIDTNVTLVDGELDRLLQSNMDFSLPTAADWRVGPANHSDIQKSSLDWYSASLPEYSAVWDSVNSWKSSQHRVSTVCYVAVIYSTVDLLVHTDKINTL